MAQALRIGKRTYAVGLSWGPLSPDRPLRAQAIEKARQSLNGLYVIYGEIEPHVGHCDAANGVRAKMAALAPLVAEIWPANTLLAVSLDEKTAVGFQILNGIIFDDVCGSPEEIRDWFNGLVGDHKWDHASNPWGLGDHQKTVLLDSLEDRRLKIPKLRSVNESRGMAIKTGAFAIAGLAAFLVASKIIQNRREMAERMEMLSRHVVHSVIPPARITPAGAFIEACRNAMERIPADPAGWNVRRVSCRPDRIRIDWGRSSSWGGTVRDLEKDLGRKVELEEGGAVRSDFRLSVPQYRIPVDRLPDLTEEKKDFISLLERYDLHYGMDNQSVLPGSSIISSAGDHFSVDLPDIPDGRLLADLSNISGLSVSSLEWAGKPQWILKGELKHAPIDFKGERLNKNRPGARLPGTASPSGPGGKPDFRGAVGIRQPGSISGSLPGGSGLANIQRAGNGRRKGQPEAINPAVHLSSSPERRLQGNP